ncbi:MAG: tetratricopeptide repeat protein [Pirellulaceae bacterium]
MLAKHVARLLMVPFVGCLLLAEVRADRPGFYPGNFPGEGPNRVTPQPRGERGPMRREYGWPRDRGGANFFFGVGPGFFLPPPYGFPSYYPNWGFGVGGPTGIFFDPSTNTAEYYLPPTYAPAELSYGPLAVDRFLGIRRSPLEVAPPAAVAPDVTPREVTPAGVAGKLRKSNEEARARGTRFLEFGNSLFLEQRFHEALQRYKSAIEAAPDMSEAYVREGFALIAVNQYRLATKAFKIALELDPEYVKSGFRLDDLYGDNRLAKTSHLELLAREAIEKPGDADLLFLVGISLYTDGEVERARRFLAKATEFGGEEAARLLAPLLGTAAPPEVVPAVPDKDPAHDI